MLVTVLICLTDMIVKNDPSEPKPQAGAAHAVDSDRPTLRPRAKPANPDTKGKKGKKSNLPVSMTSTPIKSPLKSESKKHSPILSQFSELVSREGGKGPLTNLPNSGNISRSMLSTSVLPEPINDAVLIIHEELNETKRSLQVLRSNAQHLLLSPDNVLSSLETCIINVEKLHDMLSVKFDELDNKISSLTPVPDPTEGIIRGVKALLDELPTPPVTKPSELIEGVSALLANMTPAPTLQPLASLELLTQRLDDLASENKRLANSALEAIETSCKTIAQKMSHHNDRVMEVIMRAPPTISPTVDKAPPSFMPALENVLDLIQKSPLLKNLDPISSCIENFAPELHESLLDLCNELEFTAEGGHRVSTQGAPYHYWRHALNDKSSKSTPMHAIIIALINHIKQAFPNCPLPNSCLVNMFDGPDAYLSEHEDNEKCLDPSSNIYTFSLGDLMKILFSSSIDSDVEHEFTATNGSLYVMSVASQALWRHRIEKCDAFTGRRFSITLRTVDERFRKSTVILGDSNTKYINFGEGNGSLGYGVPGKRVEAMKVGHIDPLACAGFSNVIIHCGLNDLKGNQPQPNAVFDKLINTTQAIRLVCPKARICVSPILPSKIPIVNESALAFNKLLFKHIESEAKPCLTSVDLNCFLDHRSGCLRGELGRYMSNDPFHLGRDGYRLLANVFKDMIFGVNHGLNRRASGAGFRPDTGGSGRVNTRVSGSFSGRGRRSHPVTPLHFHSSQYTYS